jgi:hypothetical protein
LQDEDAAEAPGFLIGKIIMDTRLTVQIDFDLLLPWLRFLLKLWLDLASKQTTKLNTGMEEL